MHVLFVHKEYPGHFGHVAAYLAEHEGFQCTFVYNNLPNRLKDSTDVRTGVSTSTSAHADATVGRVRLVQYQSRGASRDTNPCSLHFEISTWHKQAVFQALKAGPEIRPDLIVGHGSYGTALYLSDLYQCPTINYCEYYHSHDRSHITYRPEYPPREIDLWGRHAFNATNLLSLEQATACYCPTEWQRSLFPGAYQPKIRTIFDGIDRRFWYRRQVPRVIGGRVISPETRIVSYCAYGLEPTRGFDVFMRMAKRICDARRDVFFVVVGSDKAYYGPSPSNPSGSFRNHVLAQDRYDLDRFLFTGQVPERQLVDVLSLSDLHVYLTVPFVLSWSMMDALACACTVLGSDTPPVREMIRHEQNGLLAGFNDLDALVAQALRVLDDPEAFRGLGKAGEAFIDENYSLEKTIPKTVQFYRDVTRDAVT